MTLCKKKAVAVADVSGANRDAMEVREDFWSMTGEFITTMSCQENICMYRPASSLQIPLQYIDVVRQTKSNLYTLEVSGITGLWNIDGNRILSESWSGSTRFRILDRTTTQGLLMGRWQIDQNSSHIETRNGLARSVVIYFQML